MKRNPTMSTTPTHVNPVAINENSTVVAHYEPDQNRVETYQNEGQLEAELIKTLQTQAYEYLKISSETDLLNNLRKQLEQLNNYQFTDSEWDRFYTTVINAANQGIKEKTELIQRNHITAFKLDDGTSKNIRLIDKENIHNNKIQVINQYELGIADGANRDNRYDVTILVNGLPLVHIELKRRGVALKEAFNQINRYQRDSFWSGSGLYQFIQIFIISNGTNTKYYSNSTRDKHVNPKNRGNSRKGHQIQSFEFTSWWTDANNRHIRDLNGFARTFLAKRALLQILTRYCVFTEDKTLLVMRPYQIVATERILERINIAINNKRAGKITAGGYIWHTTGSGKTLTSFKTAQLVSAHPTIEKVLFVVDRKDLDYQTMREYDAFQKGAANSNTSTAVLTKQLADPKAKIIITTLQKLSTFVRKTKEHAVYKQHVVMIFDECHRSQFGEMHRAITRAFKNYYIFGFTGTPIFAENAGNNGVIRTTEQLFGDKLHTYTIVDAINDGNVLPFKTSYYSSIKSSVRTDEEVPGIDKEKAMLAEERIRMIASYILENFNKKTKRNMRYSLTIKEGEDTRTKWVRGFNALFAVSSIPAARRYYNAFKLLQADLPAENQLRIATIYSYGANTEIEEDWLEDTTIEDFPLGATDEEFLRDAIMDYNAMYAVNYDTTAKGFDDYYKDLSRRLKERDVDLVIVVNMFLTGFDSKTLNTLFVDKNLRSHGLIQAFSRTNRILNSVKTEGQIITFRNLEEETNKALELFGNKDAHSIVIIEPFETYYEQYRELVADLKATYPLTNEIVGESAKHNFVRKMGTLLKLENLLTTFDEFYEQPELLSPRDRQDYQSRYLDIHQEMRPANTEKVDVTDDLTFELELIKQVDINVDYILQLVAAHKATHGDGEDSILQAEVRRLVNSSPNLRDKRDLIDKFISQLNAGADVSHAWTEFISRAKASELEKIIKEYKLKSPQTERFMERAFESGTLQETGTEIVKLLPAMGMFGGKSAENRRETVKRNVIASLKAYLDRFFGIG